MYTEENVEDFKISKINSAGLINLRIHRLWEDCHRYSRQGKFLAWNGTLDRMWCELVGDVEENKSTATTWKELNEKLSKISPLKNWKLVDGFQDLEEGEQTKQNKQYEILTEKETFLRRLLNKQGKGSAYQDSIEDYMDE